MISVCSRSPNCTGCIDEATCEITFNAGFTTDVCSTPGIHSGRDRIEDEVEKTITISVEEYSGLIERDELLCALESAGVENWDGYDFALEILDAARIDRGGRCGDE